MKCPHCNESIIHFDIVRPIPEKPKTRQSKMQSGIVIICPHCEKILGFK